MRLAPFLVLLVACKPVRPAPEDLDGLQHWFFDNYEAADDEQMAEAIALLHAEVDGDALEASSDGTATDLLDEQIAWSGRDDVDPEAAAGSTLVNPFACDVETLAALLAYVDQNALYGIYDAYDRLYTSDFAAWESGESSTLTWEVDIAATLLGAEYTEHIEGGLRRVPTEFGTAIVSRTWMTEDAVFREGSAKEWPQDWQIEVYYPVTDDRIVHLYGMWREMRLGSGLSTDDEGVLRIILNNLVDWDDKTEELCLAGAP